MEQVYAKRAIRKIAEREGISEEQVTADMACAMEECGRRPMPPGMRGRLLFGKASPVKGKGLRYMSSWSF